MGIGGWVLGLWVVNIEYVVVYCWLCCVFDTACGGLLVLCIGL